MVFKFALLCLELGRLATTSHDALLREKGWRDSDNIDRSDLAIYIEQKSLGRGFSSSTAVLVCIHMYHTLQVWKLLGRWRRAQ